MFKFVSVYSVEEMDRLTHLRMDRMNIGYIDNLELVSNSLTNIYLQHVCIILRLMSNNKNCGKNCLMDVKYCLLRNIYLVHL